VNLDTRFQIAEGAYLIWEQKGCPEGRALENWLQAEAELSTGTTSELSSSSATKIKEKSKRNKR
jgi:Protein of unknown function (DUF2934)